ncbi:Cys-tRNA(Pro) deacylase [Pseudodesulfovibrio sediminis]|uniref:Cys-tRNA(Pro)/Cys-tRNA(Cys) deacylase n=1 Tax=Pseudodesulfovibrio sediminis TaxID=2810563 RepID=A0ABM7P439_9BACT|nr:Cys-tRNA(Pro) deacylase [Pseudodesulfovibrio sediminis]BCS87641.1 Cys-tRNA(Pro)/Cys-tRNA(Cys) deacylase [Pseudodesulfovibrio sediminis]
MTPAINKAKQAKINFSIHEYNHDPSAASYGEEAADKMGTDPNQVFKTLVVDGGNKKLIVAIVPVSRHLDLKALAKAVGIKKLAMADAKNVERTTGYVLGGVSPLGQKKALQTVIADSAENFPTIYVSAGRRGLEIELAPKDLAMLTHGTFASIEKA